MSNLFDQYEHASAASRAPAPVRPSNGQSAPVSAVASAGSTRSSSIGTQKQTTTPKQEDETPIFVRQRINFDPLAPISHLCACNNYLIMGLTNNQLTRVEIDNQAAVDEIELTKSVEDSIFNMFLDPTGRHIIISMTSGENLYVMRGSKKLRTLGKLKGHKLTAVGWNRHNTTESSTGEILLGTSKGLIFEAIITSTEEGRLLSGGTEQHIKQVFNLVKDKLTSGSQDQSNKPGAVQALEFDRMSTSSFSLQPEHRYFVLATFSFPSRLYQFVGKTHPPSSATPDQPIFSLLFSAYENVPERFIELPGSITNSQLQLFYPQPASGAKTKPAPKSFAWMTGSGIFCGGIDVTGNDAVTVDTKLVQYRREDFGRVSQPVAMALTEFHLLILFADKVKGVCHMNEQLVYSDDFRDQSTKMGPLLGMCRDGVRGAIWAYNSRSVFKFRVIREARDVWPMYLSTNQFELARKYCIESQGDLNLVLMREAEHLFSAKKYVDSARIYAETQCSFEEVTLKFVGLVDKRPLKQFLSNKLANLRPVDRTQTTMVVIWLTELWLNELGQLKEAGPDMNQTYDDVQEAFRKFLAQPRVKDYERVISHHIQQENYKSTLEVLSKQNNNELYYKFSPLLMQNVPADTVNAWIAKRDPQLDPRLLIPALVQHDAAHGDEAIRYLEFCVQKLQNRDPAIHNYLLSLYAKLRPDQLTKYLNAQGQEPDQICYDLKYALRLCAQLGHQKACVHIYSAMGLYDEAVDLALQVDVDLAKQNANKPEENEELKKKLWLKIARHVVEKERDIKRAMDFLHECGELLKIEDILPFFPDFVTIDHFKDAVCTSLQEYSEHIESLKEEMNEATENAREIKAEIQTFRNRFSVVGGQDKCSSCSYPLMMRAFYLFPCGHKFHTDCLASEVLPHLKPSLRAKASDLQRKLAAIERQSNNIPGLTPAASNALPAGNTASQNYREDLDDLIASECVYCGELMIRSVDRPFIDEAEYDAVIQSWL